jgi:hypothetical protein
MTTTALLSAAARSAVVLLGAVAAAPAFAQAPASAPERTGRQVYESTCIACHGPDGRGKANAELARVIALPDFSDCNFAVREPDSDWVAVVHGGGPARGFSPMMRSWASEFTLAEMKLAVEHLRTFCADDRWPRGELNLPRPLVTGKAFPEDEFVVSTTTAAEGAGQVVSKFIYEKRIGPLNQVEIAVPLASGEHGSGAWVGGLGDVALGYKRTLAHNVRRGHVVSASAEVVLPTGSERRGLGKGTTVFEPFLTYGQILRRESFVQTQAGFEIPASGDHETEAFWRAAVGRSFQQGGFGRTWSPMIEILGGRAVESGARVDWDVVPQVQVTLNARQHIRVNGGVRMPVTDRGERSTTVIFYLLWDWFDGGFLQGW